MIRSVLERINGRGYKSYKSLVGLSEVVDRVRVTVIKVQGDPFAPPSVVKLEHNTNMPDWSLQAPVATSDCILRRLRVLLKKFSMKGVGEGNSGVLSVPKLAPIMIRRSSLEVVKTGVGRARIVARVHVGLPSRGRRVVSGAAEELLLERLPKAFTSSVSVGEDKLRRHVETWIEQEHIRARLEDMGLVSFVGDGSILPRRCGGCWEPLEDAVPFESPPSLRVSVDLPTGRSITGMGIRRGLTVVSGPAYHGKTTLIEAVSAGVWNHIPGDGREYVITIRESFVVMSENGRRVTCVDLTPWLSEMPGASNLSCFTTSDASGATSVAATIQESIELGARLLIIDEDNVATNIIHRDYWLEELIGRKTLHTVADLAPGLKRAGVSVIVVATGSSELLSRADHVIVMNEYKALDLTHKARQVTAKKDTSDGVVEYRAPRGRRMTASMRLDKAKLRGRMLEVRGADELIDLRPLVQLEEETQLKTVVEATLRILAKGGVDTIGSECKDVEAKLARGGFREVVGKEPGPSLSEARALDIGFLINRMPWLRVLS